MTTPGPDPHRDAEFDRHARECYARSLSRLSPATRLRLRPAPAPPARAWRIAWPLAAACAAGALAIGLTRLPAPSAPATPTGTMPTATLAGDAPLDAVLDESPDLYLWLASTDAPDFPLE